MGGEEAERLEAERRAGASAPDSSAPDSAATAPDGGAAVPADDDELSTRRR